MTYTITHTPEGFFAVLPLGETVGPYISVQELERDMASISRHIAAGSFGGAR